MAEKKRDYAKEWQREKDRRRAQRQVVGATVSKRLADDFSAQCDKMGTTKNAVLKAYIEHFTYGGPYGTPDDE